MSIVPPEVAALGDKGFGATHLFAGEGDAALQLGPRGVTAPFKSPVDGIRLASYWLPASDPKNAKGIIVFVHGHGSYFLHEVNSISGPGKPPRYAGGWASKLNDLGYSVCGIDNRGMGFSDGARGGIRCYTDSFDHYVEDVSALASAAASGSSGEGGGRSGGLGVPPRGFGPDLPVFLLGMSLGGAIALHVAEDLRRPSDGGSRLGDNFRGCVFLAPMLALDALAARGINRLLVHVVRFLSFATPTLGVAHGTKNELYPDLQEIWDADPLCWHRATRARSAHEYLRITKNLQAEGRERLRKFDKPFIVFHGADDTLTDPKGSVDLHEASSSADKTLRVLKDRWHILTKEPGNEEVLKEIVEWCDARGGKVAKE